MRYFRIFLLNFQQAFELREMSFVWLLLSIINPLIILAYWFGVYNSQGIAIADWSLSDVSAYYFLLIIAGAMLVAHIEFDTAVRDIQEGGLVTFLLRPFSYFWQRFLGEIAWRIIQGSMAIIVFVCLLFFFGKFVTFSSDPRVLFLAIIVTALGFLISFTFKMILGLSAFWLTDFHGLQNIVEIAILVFAGFVMPLQFLPPALFVLAKFLPFAYFVYYPVIAFQGQLNVLELLQVITIQIGWIFGLTLLYRFMWKKGLQRFTGVGQ